MSKLNVLNGWGSASSYSARRSAQSYFNGAQMESTGTGCGSSCGSNDPKPSACGAADDQPKPSACGSSCGTGDK